MSTARLSTLFYVFFLIFTFPQSCKTCHNATKNFQEILESLQQPGRFEADGSMILFGRTVFTKMECLDICLRTSECGSFDMRQTQSENGTRRSWICVINRRANFEGTMLDQPGWIHFPVTSQELQEVLSSEAEFCHKKENEQELMNAYCAEKNPCNVTDTSGNCVPVWKARLASQNPAVEWCCFNPDESDKCFPVKDL